MTMENAKKMGYEGLPTRYVLYSPARGVYLGAGRWSKDDGVSEIPAPTFGSHRDCNVDQCFPDLPGERRPYDARAVEVITLPPHAFATVENCVNAGLPRWGPGAVRP